MFVRDVCFGFGFRFSSCLLLSAYFIFSKEKELDPENVRIDADL
jgi:hypothetical protein